MAANYWLKLYYEMLDDPKIGQLRAALRWRFVECLLVAGECDKDGAIPDPEEYAWRVRSDVETVETDFVQLSDAGLLSQVDGHWSVTKFAERQAPATSTERSQRHRKTRAYNHIAEPRETSGTWRSLIYRDLPEMSGIYRIWFDGDERSYIGISKNVQRRIRQHLTEMATLPGSALEKPFSLYGSEAVNVEVLQMADLADLPRLETAWIAEYGGIEKLFNSESSGKLHRDHNADATGWQRDGNMSATNRSTDTDKIRVDKIEKPPPLPSYLASPELLNAWGEWKQYYVERGKPITKSTALKQFGKFKEWGEARSIAAIDHSITNQYAGLFEPKDNYRGRADLKPHIDEIKRYVKQYGSRQAPTFNGTTEKLVKLSGGYNAICKMTLYEMDRALSDASKEIPA